MKNTNMKCPLKEFEKERKEHPTLTNRVVCQIVKDHMKMKVKKKQ